MYNVHAHVFCNIYLLRTQYSGGFSVHSDDSNKIACFFFTFTNNNNASATVRARCATLSFTTCLLLKKTMLGFYMSCIFYKFISSIKLKFHPRKKRLEEINKNVPT